MTTKLLVALVVLSSALLFAQAQNFPAVITDTANNTDLVFENTTVANSSSSNMSNALAWTANFWNGTASVTDSWSAYIAEYPGANAASRLDFIHGSSGSSGPAIVDFFNFVTSASTPFMEASSAQGGSLGIGVAADTSNNDLLLIHGQSGSPVYGKVVGVAGQSAWWQTGISGFTNAYFGCNNSGSTVNGITTANCGIGTSNANVGMQLGVNGTAYLTIPSGGGVSYGSGATAGLTGSTLCSATIGYTVGGITTCTASSDPRLKIFKPYTHGLDAILKLKPIHFHWNETGLKANNLTEDQNEEQIGFNARNVQSVMPEAVGTENHDGVDYLSLPQGDRPIVAALVNAVKEQQAEIEQLKQQIQALQHQ